MADSCPLCDKLSKLPGDELVWQFPHSVAFLGSWQYHIGYCVLVSRVHATELHRLDAKVRAAFLDEMVVMSQAIDAAFKPCKMNCESLGNQVPHVHWHLFPRSAADPEMLKPVWLALDRAERDEDEKRRLQTAPMARSEIVERLRWNLKQLNAPTL
jgi:diadenosine tetraphosphate (Ap4A) HIT family hydrolase